MTLTFGTFDGVHLGHQALLKRVIDNGPRMAVFTFTNHPSSVLNPLREKPLIYTFSHKIKILKEMGFENIISEPFTINFSKQTPEEFLNYLEERFEFDHLILGHDAIFGKDRSGIPQVLKMLAQKNGFYVEYIEPVTLNHITVSSTKIRESIKHADFVSASDMLGRPYSMFGPYSNFLEVSYLCLPPPGEYPVTVLANNTIQSATARLTNSQLFLEPTVSDQLVEIIF